MATQAEIDALYGGTTAPPPAPVGASDAADNQAQIDQLYADHPSEPAFTTPPIPPTGARPSPDQPAYAPVPGPQDSDGIFTRPIQAAEGFLSSSWHSLKDAYTGAARTEHPEYPELSQMPADEPGQTFGGGARLAAAYLTGASPAAIADVAKRALPGAVTTDASGKPLTDSFGNQLVTYNGKTYYANKPGFSAADLGGIEGQAISSLPIARVASWLAPVGRGLIPLAARSLLQGGAQGAGEAGRELGATAVGSNQGVDPATVGETAAGGALAEPVAAGIGWAASKTGQLIGSAWKSMFGYGGTLLNDAASTAALDAPVTDAMLTKTGKMVFDKAGVDPFSLTVSQLKAAEPILGKTGAQSIADEPTGPGVAQRVLQSARFGIPMTEGQLTGDTAQLGLEDTLRKGARFGDAHKTMKDFIETDQPAAVKQASSELVPGVAAGTAAPDEAAIGQNVQTAVQSKVQQLKDDTTAAYQAPGLVSLTKVGQATDPDGLYFTSDLSKNVLGDLQDMTRTRAIYSGTPATQEAQRKVAALLTKPSEGIQPGAEGATAINSARPIQGALNPSVASQVTGGATTPNAPSLIARPFNLGEVDSTMRTLDDLYRSAGNDSDRAGVAAIRNTLNDHLMGAAHTDMLAGNPDALANWVNAKAVSKTKFDFLQPNTASAQRFMDGVTDGSLTGQQVVNGLYGYGRLGEGPGTAQILDHLQTQLPWGSPGWSAVEQGAVRRMLFGTTENPATMSPANISNRITEAVEGNGKEVTARVLDPATIKDLTDFRDTMTTLRQSATQNPSNTANKMADLLRNAASKIPLIGGAFNAESQARGQAAAAVSGVLPRQFTRPTDVPLSALRTTLAPAAGAVAGAQGQVSGPARQGAAAVARPVIGGAHVAGGLLGHLNPF